MKLESQFITSFFYPFIIGVILSATIVIISSLIFTNNYIDKGTGKNIIEFEKEFSKINLNSINVIISTQLLKVQSILNELITYYINFANKIKFNETMITNINEINEEFFKSLVDIYYNPNIIEEKKDELKLMGMWFIDGGKKREAVKSILVTEYRVALKNCPVVFFQNADDRKEFINDKIKNSFKYITKYLFDFFFN